MQVMSTNKVYNTAKNLAELLNWYKNVWNNKN